jgi:hypothetical protein
MLIHVSMVLPRAESESFAGKPGVRTGSHVSIAPVLLTHLSARHWQQACKYKFVPRLVVMQTLSCRPEHHPCSRTHSQKQQEKSMMKQHNTAFKNRSLYTIACKQQFLQSYHGSSSPARKICFHTFKTPAAGGLWVSAGLRTRDGQFEATKAETRLCSFAVATFE